MNFDEQLLFLVKKIRKTTFHRKPIPSYFFVSLPIPFYFFGGSTDPIRFNFLASMRNITDFLWLSDWKIQYFYKQNFPIFKIYLYHFCSTKTTFKISFNFQRILEVIKPKFKHEFLNLAIERVLDANTAIAGEFWLLFKAW